MIEGSVIITAIVGIATTFTSGFSAWFFARKKYNSEVDNNRINNMNDTLTFYIKLSEDNRIRLELALKYNLELEKEVRELRKQIMDLMTNMSHDVPYSETQSGKLSKPVVTNKSIDKNENISKKNN